MEEQRISVGSGVYTRPILKMITYLIPLLASAAFLLSTKSTEVNQLDDSHSGRPLNVLPLPSHYTTGNSVVCLSPDFQITFPDQNRLPDDLKKAAERVQKGIWEHKHQYLSIKRGGEFFEEGHGCEYTLSTLEVHIDLGGKEDIPSIMNSAIRPAEERPELEGYYQVSNCLGGIQRIDDI
jgi:hypothetical protein